MKRRTLLQGALLGLLLPHAVSHAAQPVIQVYKSSSCGCCEGWVAHLRENGFEVKAQDVPDPTAYREKFGVPKDLGSCHTGIVGGYALEGHVPAAEIKRLLAEKPKAKGLAVPAMPLGSPGMEGPRKDAYDVFLFQADGRRSVYRHYDGKA